MGQYSNIKGAIAVINEMRDAGVIGQYAIGGAVAATFYVEPAATFDIDVFVGLKSSPGRVLATLDPIYDYLVRNRRHQTSGEHIVILDWQVQFLPSDGSPLLEEALAQAVEKDVEGMPVRVFTAEHLDAIALQLGRAKDRLRLVQFFEERVIDEARFSSIIERHGLVKRWDEFKRQIMD
jgi:hypothetical protein